MYGVEPQVAQWVVRPTHTRLVLESKHTWCKNPKNPLVFAMIVTCTVGLAAQCLNWFPLKCATYHIKRPG